MFHKFTLQVDTNLCPKNIKRRELNENKLIWRQKKTRVQWIMVKFLKEIQELSSNSLKITIAPLRGYCQGIVIDKQISEDIVQDAFVYLWNNS